MAVDDSTQAGFLARLREYLKDPAAPFLWTDAVLRYCLDAGIVEYSAMFPYRGQGSATPDGTTNLFSVARTTIVFDLVDVQLLGVPLERDQTLDGNAPETSGRYANGWAYNANSAYLTLRYKPVGAEIAANALAYHYLSSHFRWTLDTTDSTNNTTVPTHDWTLLLLLAARVAWRQADLQGLKSPADLDTGNAIEGLDLEIAALIRHRQSTMRSGRLHR